MNKNQNNLTQAFWTLGDWFHRLGGAATYPGFRESDIPLYIVHALSEHLGITLSVKDDLVDNRFKEASASVLPKVKDYIGQITASPDESLVLLNAFVEYADEKIKRMRDEDSQAWCLIVAVVSKLNAESGGGGRIAPVTPPTPTGMRLRTGRFQSDN
jgi:hypothetical protein